MSEGGQRIAGVSAAPVAHRRHAPGGVDPIVWQQGCCAWMGGHATVPQEQNTQQWPGLGRSSAPQPAQS
jgi:hypothetical protein